VSMQTAAIRIKQARANFCELMDKINLRLNGKRSGVTHSRPENVPLFTFPPVDLAGNQKFQEVCYKLWQSGVVSTQTMLQTHGYDMEQELERKKGEEPPVSPVAEKEAGKTDGEDKRGRPGMDDAERKSDPAKAMTGKQPKPSNPEGSMK
jgi:hypothetical protein